MQYFITFIEGIITFISPCLLPMLPIYISYFAGGGERRVQKTLTNALGFVLGFTAVFLAMGAMAGSLGSLLIKYQTAVNLVCGFLVILFGISYLGFFRIPFFGGMMNRSMGNGELGFFSSAVFGVIFSIGWTPCVGSFLGSALMLAGQQGSMVQGLLLLLCYSLGLGIPFLISAVLIDQLKGAFGFIKQHYQIINKICGFLLIFVGIFMATGMLGNLLAMLS